MDIRIKSLIFALVFLFSCSLLLLPSEECHLQSQPKQTISIYCKYYAGIKPMSCWRIFGSPSSPANINTTSIEHLKIHGCTPYEIKERLKPYRAITSLDISYSRRLKSIIIDFDAMSLDHLTKLDISNNLLRSTPKYLPFNLIDLDLSNNRLEEITAFPPSNLQTLDLSHNPITTIAKTALKNLTKLKYLNLNHNFLTRINWNDLKANINLKTVQLGSNPLFDINCDILSIVRNGVSVLFSWENVNSLDTKCATGEFHVVPGSQSEGLLSTAYGTIELHCKEHDLRFNELEVDGKIIRNLTGIFSCLTPSLMYLTLSGNVSQNLDSNYFQRFNLRELHLKDMIPTAFDFAWLKEQRELNWLQFEVDCLKEMKNVSFLKDLNIEGLILKRNRLKNTAELIKNLSPSIRYVEISENFVGYLETSSFVNFTNLLHLQLKAVDLKIDNFSIFEPLTSLLKFDISQNDLGIVDFNTASGFLSHLKEFRARNCNIRNVSHLIPHFSDELTFLDLSDNVIGHLHPDLFKNCTNLQFLFLHNTSLVIGLMNPFDLLENLLLLDISLTNLANADFSLLSKTMDALKFVRLAECNITNGSAVIEQFSQTLEVLDLSGNGMNGVDFTHLNGLKILNLAATQFTEGDFSKFGRLQMLNISFNQLKMIDMRLLPKYLEFLDLQGNNLVELNNFDRRCLPRLKQISIRKNRFTKEYLLDIEKKLPNVIFSDEQMAWLPEINSLKIERWVE